jgi:hypothetical protein
MRSRIGKHVMDVSAVLRERADLSAGGQTTVHGGPGQARYCVDNWEPCDYEIRQRAYEISVTSSGGRPDPQSDWLQAETELLGRRILGLT